jgi:hypothetical protein
MKILVFWDIYGRVWRKALTKEIGGLKEKYNPDFMIANIENATSGRWPIEKHILELEALWFDIMTTWDHLFDNYKKLWNQLCKEDSKILRAANYYESKFFKQEGVWHKIITKNNKRLLVIHLLWEVFMNHRVFNPFIKVDEILTQYIWENIDWVVVDFHNEATAEIYWLAHFLDWRVSAVLGTHTHVQTNDDIILPEWTSLLSDIWMNWPLFSIIWADYNSVSKRFLSWISKWKIEQSLNNDYLISAVFLEIWENMKTINIEKVKIKWKF